MKAQVSRKEQYQQYKKVVAAGSACKTLVIGPTRNPDLIHISFIGPLANVPAMKNQRIKGTNILRDSIKAHLEVMSDSFKKSVGKVNVEDTIPHFGAKFPVFCLLLLAYRQVGFDEDNCMTTVKDWLEPRYIRRNDRKWGVGIVKNDLYVSGFPQKKGKDDPDSHITEIFLVPESSICDARDVFINQITSLARGYGKTVL